MRTALLATATATAATALVAMAPPASAAAPTVSRTDSAFTTLVAGDAVALVDGYDHGTSAVGAVEVFLDGMECFATEGGTLHFDGRGVESARMSGATALVCADASGTDHAAQVTVDLAWTAAGAPQRNAFRSPQLRCVSQRLTAPAAATGTVRLQVPGRGVDVLLATSPERPAEVATQVDRCRT